MWEFKNLNRIVREDEARLLRQAGHDVPSDASLNVVERRKFRRLLRAFGRKRPDAHEGGA